MTKEPSLDSLWLSAPAGAHVFEPGRVSGFPEGARRYLEHAIAPGTVLASAVRLRMHGEIKLKRWLPFKAEQVIHTDRGMIWKATVRMQGMPIRGSDRLIDGEAAMRWKLLGIIPVMTASGPDITKSAAGRLAAESAWLPTILCHQHVTWTALDPSHPHARFAVQGETVELTLTIDGTGRLTSLKLPRWGNPEGAKPHYVDFGALVEEEGTFGGYTIPTRLRVGWYLGTDRFEPEGEFFRVTVNEASHR